MNLIQLSSQPPPLKLHLQDELMLYFSCTHSACWKRLKHLSQLQPSKVAGMNESDWMGLYSLFSCFMYLYKLAFTGDINVIWLADARNNFICPRTLCPRSPHSLQYGVLARLLFLCQFFCQSDTLCPKTDSLIDHPFAQYVCRWLSLQLASRAQIVDQPL